MKSIYTGFLLLAFFCISLDSICQQLRPYPIPSYGILVNQNSLFEEHASTGGSYTEGKKKIYTKPSCNKSASDSEPCNIVIFFYSLDGLDILGPYSTTCGETITQEIDDRDWGAFVHSDCLITIDVWIETSAAGGTCPQP